MDRLLKNVFHGNGLKLSNFLHVPITEDLKRSYFILDVPCLVKRALHKQYWQRLGLFIVLHQKTMQFIQCVQLRHRVIFTINLQWRFLSIMMANNSVDSASLFALFELIARNFISNADNSKLVGNVTLIAWNW